MSNEQEDLKVFWENIEAERARIRRAEDLAYNQGRLDAQAEMAPRIRALQETVAAYKKMTNEILEQVTKGLHPLAVLHSPIGHTPLPTPQYNAQVTGQPKAGPG